MLNVLVTCALQNTALKHESNHTNIITEHLNGVDKNPNTPSKQEAVSPLSKEKNRFRNIVWDEYDNVHQKYLEISMKPRMKNHFRAHQLSVWLRLVPELHHAGMENALLRHNQFHDHDDGRLYHGVPRQDAGPRRYDSAATDTAGLGQAGRPANGSAARALSTERTCAPGLPPSTHQLQRANNATSPPRPPAAHAVYSTALGVTIAIGCSLLVLNVLIFAGVYYRLDRSRVVEAKPAGDLANNLDAAAFAKARNCHSQHHPDGASTVVDVERDDAPIAIPTAGGELLFGAAKQRHAGKATNLVNKFPGGGAGQQQPNELKNLRNARRARNYVCSSNGSATLPLAARHQPPSPGSVSLPPQGGPAARGVLVTPAAAMDEMRA